MAASVPKLNAHCNAAHLLRGVQLLRRETVEMNFVRFKIVDERSVGNFDGARFADDFDSSSFGKLGHFEGSGGRFILHRDGEQVD